MKIAHHRDRGAIEDRVRSSKAVSYYFIPASNVCDGRGLPRAHPALILSKSARSCDHEHDICRSLLSAAANIACGPSRDRASGRGRLGIPISDRTVCAMGLAETCPHTQCDISLYYGRSVGRYTSPLPMGHTATTGHPAAPIIHTIYCAITREDKLRESIWWNLRIIKIKHQSSHHSSLIVIVSSINPFIIHIDR